MSVSRRQFFRFSAAALPGFAALSVWAQPLLARLIGARVWPAAAYTRVTFESNEALKHTYFFVRDPERLVVDVENVDLVPELVGLATRVGDDDPYIKTVRVGRNRPGVIRIVFDLRQRVAPQVFALAPVGRYAHRLVMDIYPEEAPDPLIALLNEQAARRRQAGGAVDDVATAGGAKPPAGAAVGGATIGPVLPGPPASAPTGKLPPVPPATVKPPIAPSTAVKASPSSGRLTIIALDPGHGGEDPGAVGAAGNYEKDVVLAIALRLRDKLEAQPNTRVLLTRDGDYFVPLHERVAKARKVEADLFVSIHADAFIVPTARGASVFALSERGATSAAAKWIASKENQSDLIGGVNIKVSDQTVARVLLDMSQTVTIKESLRLGAMVLGELKGMARLHKSSVEQAGFAVLRAPDMPSILIETAFISNPEEEAKLIDPAYQDQLATAIAKGLRRHLARQPARVRSGR